MQFVINTSLEPFGCALLDDRQIVSQSLWEDFRKGGEAAWEFLDSQKQLWDQIDHIGGISGPGGFSNLRVAGVILNALSLRFNLPIHQIRADKVVEQMLADQNHNVPFLLNSFSDSVFFVEGTDLVRISREEAVEKYRNKEVCVDFLPLSKQKTFTDSLPLDLSQLYRCIGAVLKNTKPQKIFIPDYEYPAVQNESQ